MRHPSCLSSRFTTFPKCFFFGLYHHDPGPPSSPRPIDGADSTVTYWNYASDSFDVPRRIYLLRDHLGSVRVAADSAGKALLVHHYYPYGGDLTLNVSNIQEPGIPAGGLDPLDPGILDPLDPIFIDPEEPIETQLPPENPYRFIGKETAGGDGLVLYDFGARYYTPSIPQWTTMDPLSEKYYSISPYVYCVGDPISIVDPTGQDGIYIVFPDYVITVGDKKYNHLGHAGVLLINPDSGFTRYYEYGRYDPDNKGEVRTYPVPNVELDECGEPTSESLNNVLEFISKKSGQSGRIEGAYIKSRRFNTMNDYAEKRVQENSNAEREPYSIVFNNCASFVSDVLDQDISTLFLSPAVRSPIPIIRIKQYQLFHQRIIYPPHNK